MKKKRKMRPEPPRWFTLDTDNCWFCERRKSCNGCKLLKELEAYKNAQRERKEKFDLRNYLLTKQIKNGIIDIQTREK